ncbi:IS200/IS605 family transposase [Fibrella forsythiae]|uniref:IS200/IS605 family transposase n=1 Tax=Fibrella forsythiae TaxID=2817061 RepID=A0ABS3JJW7_9BACT|nr:IS200/IS605 family transposase [Fibrella forsythiae]MBO0950302.1 IS200/IS605 family transposase [Fibrella forsythiae]
MANTYSQLYLHVVFAVKHRHGLIRSAWKEDLYRYMTGIVRHQGHKLIAINGMPDHVHAFIGVNPKQAIAELVQYFKMDSSKWINEKRLTPSRFEWQTGYGAFSYSHSQIGTVVNYIENQEQHHQKQSVHDEYIAFLQKFDVPYDERYVFAPIQGEDV